MKTTASTKSALPTSAPSDGADPFITDSVVSQTMSEDPVAKFIIGHFRQIFGVVVVGILVFWGVTVFQNSARERMQASADTLMKVRRDVTAWESAKDSLAKETDATKKEAAKKTLDDAEISLAESIRVLGDTEKPYRDLAPVYRGLLESGRLQPDTQKLRSELASINWSSISTESERFAAELHALVLARALLDDSGSVVEAKASLKALAEGGKYSAVPAAMALSGIAISNEDRKLAAETLNNLMAAHPESRELIEPELARLK